MKSDAGVLLIFSLSSGPSRGFYHFVFSPRSVFSSFPGEKQTLKEHLILELANRSCQQTPEQCYLCVRERANVYACLQGLCGLLPLPGEFVCVCEKRQKGETISASRTLGFWLKFFPTSSSRWKKNTLRNVFWTVYIDPKVEGLEKRITLCSSIILFFFWQIICC